MADRINLKKGLTGFTTGANPTTSKFRYNYKASVVVG
jgi:hypothetical protein